MLLPTTPGAVFPSDWSPDGQFVLYQKSSDDTRADLWALPLFGTQAPLMDDSWLRRSHSPQTARQWAFPLRCSGRTSVASCSSLGRSTSCRRRAALSDEHSLARAQPCADHDDLELETQALNCTTRELIGWRFGREFNVIGDVTTSSMSVFVRKRRRASE